MRNLIYEHLASADEWAMREAQSSQERRMERVREEAMTRGTWLLMLAALVLVLWLRWMGAL